MQLLFLMAAALMLTALAAANDQYDAVCESIVHNAQLAARARNRGDMQQSEQASDAAVAAYRRAVAISPEEPQAHLHAGTFMYNTHRFDEAIAAWGQALPLTAEITSPAPSGGTWRSYLEGRLTAARLGRAAVVRDAEYASGQGNLTAAYAAAMDLVRTAPRAPHFLFEAGTIAAVMAGSVNGMNVASSQGSSPLDATGREGSELESIGLRPNADAALALFRRAQSASAEAAAAFFRREAERSNGPGAASSRVCPQSVRLSAPKQARAIRNPEVGGEPAAEPEPEPEAEAEPVPEPEEGETYGGFAVARPARVEFLRGGGSLHGAEGVLVVLPALQKAGPSGDDAAACAVTILQPSGAAPFLPLHANLWLSEEAWRADGAVKLFDHRGPEAAAKADQALGRMRPWVPAPVQRRVRRVATIVGFASSEFFHFLLEA